MAAVPDSDVPLDDSVDGAGEACAAFADTSLSSSGPQPGEQSGVPASSEIISVSSEEGEEGEALQSRRRQEALQQRLDDVERRRRLEESGKHAVGVLVPSEGSAPPSHPVGMAGAVASAGSSSLLSAVLQTVSRPVGPADGAGLAGESSLAAGEVGHVGGPLQVALSMPSLGVGHAVGMADSRALVSPVGALVLGADRTANDHVSTVSGSPYAPPMSPSTWLQQELGGIWEEEARGVAERAVQQWAYAQASALEAEQQANAERKLALALEGQIAQSAGDAAQLQAAAQQSQENAHLLEGQLAQTTATETHLQALAHAEAQLVWQTQTQVQQVEAQWVAARQGLAMADHEAREHQQQQVRAADVHGHQMAELASSLHLEEHKAHDLQQALQSLQLKSGQAVARMRTQMTGDV